MKRRISLVGAGAMMLLAGMASSQTVTSSSVSDIPNNGAGNEPFAGGARVAHVVNTGAGAAVRDFHVCVAQSRTRAQDRRVSGDAVNDNYRESPGGTPAGWAYRGVQAGTPAVAGGTTTTKWYVTWVKTTPGGAPNNAALTFQYDYKGPNRVRRERGRVVFTNDGNINGDNGTVGNAGSGIVPIAASTGEEFPGGLPGLIALAVVIGVVLSWFAQTLVARRSAADGGATPTGE